MDKSFAKTFGVKGQINSEREAQETGINQLISGYNGLSHRKKYLSIIRKVNAPDLPEVLAILKLCPRCFYISSFVVIALVAMWLLVGSW